jgi:uncharacterized protein
MLDVLQRMWLVERIVPVTVSNPERSKQTIYRIADPCLRFWFRFVLPSQDRLLDPVGARRHLRARVLPELDGFVPTPAFELDAVAVDDDGRTIAIGSCKWTGAPLPYSEKAKLEALARHLVPQGPAPDMYFFARSGFDPRLVADAERDPRIRLVTPDQLM